MREAAQTYKVGIEAIALKVKQEFAAALRSRLRRPSRRAVTKTHRVYLIRHGELSGQWLIAFSAHAVDLSV
jgi:hypothetical protein